MSTTEALRPSLADTVTARPIAVICELLGVPRDHRRLFRRWADDLTNPKTLDALHAYIDVMIADRCCKPADDLLCQLIQLDVDGEDLTVDEIHQLVIALLADADLARCQRIDLTTWVRWNCQRSTMRNPTFCGTR